MMTPNERHQVTVGVRLEDGSFVAFRQPTDATMTIAEMLRLLTLKCQHVGHLWHQELEMLSPELQDLTEEVSAMDPGGEDPAPPVAPSQGHLACPWCGKPVVLELSPRQPGWGRIG